MSQSFVPFSELTLFDVWDSTGCSFLKGTAKGLRKPLMTLFEKAFLGLTKSKFDLTCHWKEVEGKLLLEALEPVQSAVTRHPDTKEITWVCNVHNHSRYLRNRYVHMSFE